MSARRERECSSTLRSSSSRHSRSSTRDGDSSRSSGSNPASSSGSARGGGRRNTGAPTAAAAPRPNASRTAGPPAPGSGVRCTSWPTNCSSGLALLLMLTRYSCVRNRLKFAWNGQCESTQMLRGA